ncbi:MAG TPA: hypothetical protein VH371_06195 [Candidatus Limnocylindrales bacterium]|jgi:hypothetical protein
MRTRRAVVSAVTFAAVLLALVSSTILAASGPAALLTSRPDVAIRSTGVSSSYGTLHRIGRWVGTEVRSISPRQQVLSREFAGAAPRGTKYLFQVKVTNHGATDRLVIEARGTDTWAAHYFAGKNDVTAAVRSGTFRTPLLARGESFVLQLTARLGRPGTSMAEQISATPDAVAGTGDSVSLRLAYSNCGC